MPALIDRLFSDSQAVAIRKLWDDKGSRLLIKKEVGKILLNNNVIIEIMPLTQLMFISSLSPFADSPEECYDVAEIIFWGINHTDILPYVTKYNGRDLAYRCLISLAFFKKMMMEKQRRYGYPSPDFYRNVGIKTFNGVGMSDVGSHFRQWENFLGEIIG